MSNQLTENFNSLNEAVKEVGKKSLRLDKAQDFLDTQEQQGRENLGVYNSEVSLDSLVSVDKKQAFTDEEKAQGRENLDVLNAEETKEKIQAAAPDLSKTVQVDKQQDFLDTQEQQGRENLGVYNSEVSLNSLVSVDKKQAFTEDQKKQGRENLGVFNTKGEKGDKGDTGATGAKGDKGDNGVKGATGVKGERGYRGYTGATGTKGDKGDKGESATDLIVREVYEQPFVISIDSSEEKKYDITHVHFKDNQMIRPLDIFFRKTITGSITRITLYQGNTKLANGIPMIDNKVYSSYRFDYNSCTFDLLSENVFLKIKNEGNVKLEGVIHYTLHPVPIFPIPT